MRSRIGGVGLTVLAAALAGLPAATASAARPKLVPTGSFSVFGGPDDGPLVALSAIDRGRAVAAGAVVSCSTGASPVAGLPVNAGIVLRVPRRFTITRRHTFSYAGAAAVFVLGSTGRTDVRAQLKLEGRFAREESSPFATAVEGMFSSSVCSSSTTDFAT